MDMIIDRMEEYILSYIWYHYDKSKIHSPNDVLHAIDEGDGTEDLKEQLWQLFKYELPLSNIFDEVQRRKEEEKEEETEESEEEEEEAVTEESEEED